jgi:hypothetical protein
MDNLHNVQDPQRFGLQSPHILLIDEEPAVGVAEAFCELELPDGDAATGTPGRSRAALDDPPSLGEEFVKALTGDLLATASTRGDTP